MGPLSDASGAREEPNSGRCRPRHSRGGSGSTCLVQGAFQARQKYPQLTRGADRRYSGLICKNPLHADWRVEWRRAGPYTLHELADWLFSKDMRPDAGVETTFGIGRNCAVFDDLRRIAYREVRSFKSGDNLDSFQARLERAALGMNMQFPQALPLSEVYAIAKSVARWTWRHFSEAQFSQLQSLRGARRSAQMWAGHVSREKTKPWRAEGISRATWYRHRYKGARPD